MGQRHTVSSTPRAENGNRFTIGGTVQTGASALPHRPCDHYIKSKNVIKMVGLCLKKGNLDFSCPVCGEPWDWAHVWSLFQFSQNQLAVLEEQVDHILQALPERYKRCPVCLTIIRRPLDSTGLPCPFSSCARCRVTHHFCWACLAPWVFPYAASAGQCSNRSCALVAMLQSCGRVSEAGSAVWGCPLFRACPQCHALIMHVQACKYISCPDCGHDFCFICLESHDECGRDLDLYFIPRCAKPRAARQCFVTA